MTHRIRQCFGWALILGCGSIAPPDCRAYQEIAPAGVGESRRVVLPRAFEPVQTLAQDPSAQSLPLLPAPGPVLELIRPPIGSTLSTTVGPVALPTSDAVVVSGLFGIPTYPVCSDYSVDAKSQTITFNYSTRKNIAGGFDVVNGRSKSESLVINPTSTSGLIPAQVEVTLRATLGRNRVVIESKAIATLPAEGPAAYKVDQDDLSKMAARLVDQANNGLGHFDADRPIVIREPMTLTLAPVASGLPPSLRSADAPVAGSIRLVMQQVALDEPAGPGKPAEKQAGPAAPQPPATERARSAAGADQETTPPPPGP